MRLDKRGIETLSLCAFLGLLAVGTSVLKPTTPQIQSDLSTPVIESDASMGAELTDLNAGTTISFNTADEAVISASGATTEKESTEVVATAPTTPAKPASPWDSKFFMNTTGAVNIRAEADLNGAIIGKLFENGAGDVIEKGETWTKISSGSVEGYIATEFIAFGAEAEKLAEGKGSYKTTVLEDYVRVRKEPSTASYIEGFAEKGEKFQAVDGTVTNGFVAIIYGDQTAYITTECTKTEYELDTAKSLKELEVERAKRIAAQQAENVRQGASYAASADDVSLLAALVYCEAGMQSHAGKLAVASVVMNRVRSGRYPNTIFEVIYQSGQFPPASVVGRVGTVLMNHSYNADCVAAAQEAISGISNVGGAIGFDFASSGKAGIVIGPVVFF